MDLFAHCDGEVSDLMRDKAANLFSPSFRSAVKGSGKAGEGSSSARLLGGETAVRSHLIDATKEDEPLTKTMQKPFKRKGNSHGGYQRSKGKEGLSPGPEGGQGQGPEPGLGGGFCQRF